MKDKKFLEIVKDTQTVLIIASRPLDFDCLGSSLMLKKYLEYLGKTVTLMWPGKFSQEDKEYNSFLPYFNEVVDQDTREVLSKKNHDLLIFVDGVNLVQFYDDRKEEKIPNIEVYDKRVHIDHHLQSPERLGTFELINSKASATAEVILDKIIPEDFIDENIATLSYAAIAADTGNFQWNFTSQTLKFAAVLKEKGAHILEIVNKISCSNSKSYLQMLAFAIENIEYQDNLKTIFTFLPYQKIKEAKMSEYQLGEFKRAFCEDIARKVQGFDRGILVYEPEPKRIKITVRGNNLTNKINMPKLLQGLRGNGGGHFNACGADIQGDFEEIKKRLIGLICEHLKEESGIVPATTKQSSSAEEQSRSAASAG